MKRSPRSKTFILLFLTSALLFAANVLYSLRAFYQDGLLCLTTADPLCAFLGKFFALQTWRAGLTTLSVLLFILLASALRNGGAKRAKTPHLRLIHAALLTLILHTTFAWIAASQENSLFLILARMSYILLLALTVTSTVLSLDDKETGLISYPPGNRTQKIILSTLILSSSTLVSGAVSTLFPPGRSCGVWPLCPDRSLPASLEEWIYLLHVAIVGATAFFLTWLLLNTWREYKNTPRILVTATLTLTLFLGEIMIGAFQVSQTQPMELMLLHAQTSIAVWVALTVMYGFVLGSNANEGIMVTYHPTEKANFAWKNFFQITKPLIVLLLLFTTFTGMVTASKGLPDLSLTLITLLAGGLAAGGSGAINQYIDRNLDREMKRTAQRPIASGKIFPAEGLAFGIGLLVISFYLMAKFVNMPAALLSIGGMLYYLLAYSLILKQRTTWNIVIGGGAGAIPPLVGWAAVQGHLDVFAWGLFLIILLWTPTHFWSLALVRQEEYATANIPMLPVTKGRKHTIRVIMGSTILLVVFTLVFAVWSKFSWVYPITALLAGLVLIYFATKLWRRDDNHIAHALYRCSNFYLGILFFSLILESIAFS